uniref:Uncharacterized protein n=1 Tax=Opuntia streptacantha TaxID=393608 RepID=A0A7C9EI59_OPUST
MAVKRGLVENSPEFQETQQGHRRFKFTKCLFKDEWLHKYSAQLENVIRKAVREETEKVILHHLQSIPRSSTSEAEQFKLRKFKLQFEGQLPRRYYTGNSIEAEGLSPIKVVLLDALSGNLVKDGPLSSAKIEIVALHGHFKAELLEDWTQKEFSDNIVPARDGKRPLLIGERVIALCNGIGFINGICFTDNSSWERSKMFRLGAKIELKMAKEDEVREAVSSAFEVKDRRGETYQKHITLSLEDDVWRLRGIAKDGKICKRLADHQIYKVKDFLHVYHIDQSFLRNIVQLRPKLWEAIVQQITLCFSSSACTNLNALTPNYVSTEPISRTSVSSLHRHHFAACGASQAQPEVQMLYSQGMGTSNETDQSMALNGDTVIDANLMGDFFEELCDDRQSFPVGYMASSSLGGPSLFGQGHV